MKKLLARLVRQSPAMIVAMVALFVALSGTAVATTSALIGSAQIRNNSITGLDVKNRSLRPIDFRGSVRGARGVRGLAGPAGPPGAAGAAGAAGAKGDKGDTGPSDAIYVRNAAIVPFVAAADQTVVTANLSAGKWVVTANTTANNNAATQQTIRCSLLVGGTTVARTHASDNLGVPLGVSGALDRHVIALTGAAEIAAPGAAALVCQPNAGASGNYVDQSLTAIRVATLNGA